MSTPTQGRPAMDLAQPMLDLGQLTLAFGRVDRITYHEDGVTPESDTDHTVMLGVLGCAFAATHLPKLDLGKIAQYALVHDLVEVYAGDTPTLRLAPGIEANKALREQAALDQLRDEYQDRLPWLISTIEAYEARIEPEARYVKALDKLLPKITHVLNGGATFEVQGMTQAELAQRYAVQLDSLNGYAADFPELLQLRTELIAQVMQQACVA
jgi:putative hydrolase of HD superfamily